MAALYHLKNSRNVAENGEKRLFCHPRGCAKTAEKKSVLLKVQSLHATGTSKATATRRTFTIP